MCARMSVPMSRVQRLRLETIRFERLRCNGTTPCWMCHQPHQSTRGPHLFLVGCKVLVQISVPLIRRPWTVCQDVLQQNVHALLHHQREWFLAENMYTLF